MTPFEPCPNCGINLPANANECGTCVMLKLMQAFHEQGWRDAREGFGLKASWSAVKVAWLQELRAQQWESQP